ncbi:hypothetical protein B9Z55_009042 [Caenorhabditis nigoni]|uniref:F-box associated domain-containing protein n=1 Tax=Caenorhabditis nigoni TaxID=1611254 RepID=A0A2G5UQ97_9PELO|nr:hypothetical protein B9Z55_009042 [Caenorhabditis nigoni]
MVKLIKSSQAKRFKSIPRIGFEMRREHPTICVSSKSTDYVMMISSNISEDLKNDYFQLNVSEKIINFEFVTCGFPIVAFHQCDKEVVFTSIHNYFLDLFGNTIEYEWTITDCQFVVPRVPHSSLILTFWTTSTAKENMERLEAIPASTIIKHITTIYWRPAATLKPESKFYQAESIKIQQDNLSVPVNLGSFQGRQAFFRCDRGRISNLIKFVNRWKSGKAFQRLEYLEIIIDDENIVPNKILNAIGVKYIDATKTPPTHTLPKVYFESGHKPNTDPINSRTYVVRETDNRVASISMQWKSLSFGVWNETEEKFLAMVK